MNMDARGMKTLVGTLLKMDIWNVFDMPMKMDVRGMNTLVGTLPNMDI
jgi:hypothetical protein